MNSANAGASSRKAESSFDSRVSEVSACLIFANRSSRPISGRERNRLLHFGADALEPAAPASGRCLRQELDQPRLPDARGAVTHNEGRALGLRLRPQAQQPIALCAVRPSRPNGPWRSDGGSMPRSALHLICEVAGLNSSSLSPSGAVANSKNPSTIRRVAR